MPGAVDASALFRSVLVSLGSTSALIVAMMLSILSISDCPSKPITKADESMS